MTDLTPGQDAPAHPQAEPWTPAFLGLVATAALWSWGLAALSGCALPWACATTGRIDPALLALLHR